ncbi:circularly permuted type 2 ATP-grasp protein [Dyadobacter arcticus]|uniref:Circularly permuted ATP-grasp superfamily protein/putative alpha-E superfamily protein n=1 Tax=Dyadobacter arcticus TaxID=1078754 RepID=A0ABX0UEK1_9BACT|nr:circularly permuted type 2 ATP-grasp protein [Dyadobacter arcticus]NIJ51082.1 putative circularly permuted ATP-grasp superfamily protein/putative alpha-E superfamily protein [Dyadobacter arcticus]
MLTEASVNLLESYTSGLNSYDEVLDSKGVVKPHWKALFSTLEKLGIRELNSRNQEIIGKLRENGVTYNVYGTADGLNRPWQLDPIPFLIEQKEWNEITKGLQQRAVLLDLMLKDLYGPRDLVRDGIIPAELVFDNTGFFRPCIDIRLPASQQLTLFAADMARGPDGQMWIVDNRTQAPSGSGYTLENRVVMSKLLPELAQGMYVSKLAPYFNSLQNTVLRLSDKSKDAPNIVYLTPGPNNEAYFEHAYLASYLGYTLAQGDDLLVRNGCVWLKSIDGLQKVDVIIRRIDDDWCDPLELREESRLGVPGLLQAIRLGNVQVLNAPGTSVLENHAFLAFMENICQYFLNEKLIMPSVATWWCGHAKELRYVLANLDELIIKKANRKTRFRSIYGRQLSLEQKEEVKRMISLSPHEFIAQQEVSLSTTPSLIDGNIEPRYAVLRAFMVADENGYHVMQGGLTRSSAVKDRFVISNQYGGFSKDTWIVSNKTEEIQEKIILSTPATVNKHVSLPSRSAENLFWVGRYCERTMAIIKFMNITINVLNLDRNFGGSAKQEHIKVLLQSLTHLSATYPGFLDEEEDKFLDPYKEIIDMISNTTRPGSVSANIGAFLNAVGAVRNQWDLEIWRIVDLIDNGFHEIRNASSMNSNNIQKTLDGLFNNMFTFLGVIAESMPRDNSFLLLETGKLIERILSRISVIQSNFGVRNTLAIENELIEATLINHHLLVNYRQVYKSHLSVEAMLDMVLLEKNLPYSLAYMLDELRKNLSQLPSTTRGERLNEAEKYVLKASTLIKLANIADLSKSNFESEREELFELLSEVSKLISSVSTTLTNMYFSHTLMQHSFFEPVDYDTNEI